MDVIEREQLNFLQALDHWYYRTKYRAMLSWICSTDLNAKTARVGDFGCGTGLFLSLLIQGGGFHKENLLGIDSAYEKETVLSHSGVRVVPSLEKEGQFDLFLLMDVLEHIEDDRGALESVLLHCRAGGYLFITVPAMEWLWSGHDSYLGHKRRYSVKSLGNLLKSESCLEVIGLHYLYASILPIAVPWRLMRKGQKDRKCSDMRPSPKFLNMLLEKICLLETLLMKKNKIAGLTAIALCQKH